jgi:hypothetical protein
MMDRNKTIAMVHAGDVASARAMINQACRDASAAWIPADAIVDALLLEWIEQAGQFGDTPQLLSRVEQLRQVLVVQATSDRRQSH